MLHAVPVNLGAMTKPADSVIALYRRHADAWVQRRGAGGLEANWLDRFLALVPDRADVLDVGCGHGAPMAQVLLDHGHHVTGVDAAPELIAIAKTRAPQATWIVEDMRQMDFGQRFQGILAWNSLFHLPPADQRRLFAVLRRHAAPGAALLFTSGPAAGETCGCFEGAPLYHASLDPEEYRSQLKQNGFHVVDHRIEDPDCGQHTVWLAQCAKGR